MHERLIGPASGRAFSHELGHYILKSNGHTSQGLMRAAWPSEQLLVMMRFAGSHRRTISESRSHVRSDGRGNILQRQHADHESRDFPIDDQGLSDGVSSQFQQRQVERLIRKHRYDVTACDVGD